MLERPLLVLDLDETLIWATRDEPPAPPSFRVHPYHVTKRPHLDEFLDTVLRWFQCAVWTSAGTSYATAVVSEVFRDPSELAFVWDATRCTHRYSRETNEHYWVKDLRKVARKGFPLTRVLMIDDSPEKLERQYGNHLRLRPFEGDVDDRELRDVLPFLDWIRTQDNFRKIEKRNWRSRSPGYGSA